MNQDERIVKCSYYPDKGRVVKYSYYQELDLLYVSDISPIGVRGKYANGYDFTEGQGVGFILSIDENGRSIGFEFFDAAELLLPYLLPDEFQKTNFRTNLTVEYCAGTDILRLNNGKSSVYSETVTEDWITYFNDDFDPYENYDVGEVVAFTLGRVSENILPLLVQYAPLGDYDPDKQERMRRFRKSGVTG